MTLVYWQTLRSATRMRGIMSSLTAVVLMSATAMVAQSVSQFPTGQFYQQDIAFDGTNIWIAGQTGVTKLRASDGTNLGTFPLGPSWGVAFDGANIWVSIFGGNECCVTKLRASDGPGAANAWTTGNKLALGTSADTTSKVWFTVAKGSRARSSIHREARSPGLTPRAPGTHRFFRSASTGCLRAAG